MSHCKDFEADCQFSNGKIEIITSISCCLCSGDISFLSSCPPNKKALNPNTKAPYTGITALCLGCHEAPERGGAGIAPVSGAMSHPFSVIPNPKVATVPQGLLRDGKLECSGCHDPHPSNPNYKYLRVDTKGGKEMEVFCAVCHPSKAEKAPKEVKIFDSMDERKFAEKPGQPAAPAPQPKKTQ